MSKKLINLHSKLHHFYHSNFNNLDTTVPTITINNSIPSSITKGDSYQILGSYSANGPSGGNASCSSNLNGTVININQLTTLGNHTIRCTSKTGAGKTATATKIVKITYQTYTAVNLIKNGSFENGNENWSFNNAHISTQHMDSTNSCYTAATGNYNLKFLSGFSASYQDLDYTAPILNHKYYSRLLHLNPFDFSSGDSRFEWWYNDIAGAGTLIFARKGQVCECWGLLSSIQTITTNTYLSNKWVLRNFYVDMSPEAFVDDLVLIDLTATFGAGNEPDKDWCDRHINYFDGTTAIYK